MIKKIVFNFVFLTILIQNQTFGSTLDTNRYFGIHFSPLYVFHPQPRWRVGLEWIKPYGAFSLDAGFGNNSSLEIINQYSDYSLFELRPEWKWYSNPERFKRFYTSVEFYYLGVKSLYEDDYYFEKDNDEINSFIKATVINKNYGLFFKLGKDLWFFNKIQIDLFAGLGFNLQNLSYVDVELDTLYFGKDYSTSIWTNSSKHEGYNVSIKAVVGMKIGIVFRKKNDYSFKLPEIETYGE